MNAAIEHSPAIDKGMPMRDVIARLQETLRRNHDKILEAARSDWQSTYGASDPTDTCVSIRVTAPKSQVKRRSSKRKPAPRWGC